MAEQSSTVAAFRALVMLVCLTVIAVAAFCGGSFPAVVKAIQSGRMPTLADFRGPSGPPPSPMTEAPRFAPPPSGQSQPANAQAAGFTYGGASTAAADSRASQGNAKTPGFAYGGPLPQGNSAPSGVIAANYSAPIPAPGPNASTPSTSFPQSQDPGIGPAHGLSPVPPGMDNLLPVDHQGIASRSDTSPSVLGSAGGASRDEQLKGVLDRLKQMGATYFVLETCSDQQREFRFLCKMAVGGNPQVTKSFWCLDGDALNAMTHVLKQVEDWQRGGG
jgi:hypothetical protein